jgi:hypothetical protein
MTAEFNIIAQYLPASLAVFGTVLVAGIMGLFRAFSVTKKAHDDTLGSLQRQLDVIMQENAVLRKALEKCDNCDCYKDE